MNKTLDDLLCQRYPLIFAQRHLPTTQSCTGWGFTSGDGWFELIDSLCERLQFWTDYNEAPQVVATQVKEKFGGLRFYTTRQVSPEQQGMIQMAEALSLRICEKCGKPGQTLVDACIWLTRCADHAPDGAIPVATYLEHASRR